MASNQISANHHWRLCVFAVLFFDKNYDNKKPFENLPRTHT